MDSLSDRSVKSVHDEFEGDCSLAIEEYAVPRVEMEDEYAALHEMVTKQQLTIQNLMSELEEERNAAASAANEAMSMILRLQRDKAEVQMEARQFKQLAEEKMSYNLHETSVLEDMLYKRDQKILSLACEIQSYGKRMLSYGISEADGGPVMIQSASFNDFSEGLLDYPPYEMYPSLRCYSDGSPSHLNEDDDMEKYAFVENVHSLEQLNDLKSRIYELENNPSPAYPGAELTATKNMLESVGGHFPGKHKHPRKLSLDSMSSPYAVNKEICSDFFLNSAIKNTEFPNKEENFDLDKMEDASEFEADLADRIYTVDSVFHGPLIDPSVASPRALVIYPDPRDLEIEKLYARVHALEADRESMRQAIISVSSNKAQMVLLKEIAQNLCKEMSLPKRILERKQPESRTFSLKSIFMWLLSGITFWRKRTHRCRYMFEESAYNLLGLLILLENHCGYGRNSLGWRFVLRTDLLNGSPRITV